MEPGNTTLLRSKWLAVTVHLALWALLALVLLNLRGTMPHYRDVASYSLPVQGPAPVSHVGELLNPTNWPPKVLLTNLPSPFFTTAFIPVPKPPAPPPPAPTTRKITVVYQGYFSSGDGPRMAMVRMPEGISTPRLGGQIVTNHFVADLTHSAMTLTNVAGQTNVFLLNTAKELEIPIK